jgi:thioredoxin 1
VLKATRAVVVDFAGGAPCRMIDPALEEIASLSSKVKTVKLNVDESPNGAKYGIMSIPTLMMFKGNELASRQVDATPKQARAVDHPAAAAT